MLWFTTKTGGQLGIHRENVRTAVRIFGVGREEIWLMAKSNGQTYEVWFEENKEVWKDARMAKESI